MDISNDSKLIVTCSADKNVKIWGLDFGDCHKSIFAHEESVMQVAFEKDSHYFWTVGKDKLLKYWDGDKVCSFIFLVVPEIYFVCSLRTSKSWMDTMERFGHLPSVIKENSLLLVQAINPYEFMRNSMILYAYRN